MIRTLAIAAAAAAVGYLVGQRAGAESESRFSRPEVTGDDPGGYIDADDVVVEDGAELNAKQRRKRARRIRQQIAYPDNPDEEVIGQ